MKQFPTYLNYKNSLTYFRYSLSSFTYYYFDYYNLQINLHQSQRSIKKRLDWSNLNRIRSITKNIMLFFAKIFKKSYFNTSKFTNTYQLNVTQMHLSQLHVKIGISSLNNDPLDFSKNFKNIMKSIQICKDLGCSIRVGSELQICGYGCHDHYQQYDTIYHSWDVVRDILQSKITQGIVVDVGCPVLHKAALYNARVLLHNNKIIGIRPKMILADGDNYFQTRQFASWDSKRSVGTFKLPQTVQDITGQTQVPIGIFIIEFNDTSMAYQICQQSWISNNPMIDAALDGAEIFINPSASDSQRGKLKRKIQMISEFTVRHGGAYCYVNQRGIVGDRTYFDGCCMFSQNGKIKYLSPIHDLEQVSVLPVLININAIRTFRISNKSFQKESHQETLLPRVKINLNVANCEDDYLTQSPQHLKKLEELRNLYQYPHATYQPSIFLWQVLRKSHARGFFLPLSGGLDSCTVALIVYNMCCLVYKHIAELKNQTILTDLRRILRNPEFNPKNPQDICKEIFYTAYMGTENSSSETKERAEKIAKTINCNHRAIKFDSIYKGFQQLGKQAYGQSIKFKNQGGTWGQDLALQNIQARTRMVLSYFMAQLQIQKPFKPGFLLVLGSSNLDEALRGYFTKYDCSSADYNPIGSFSKNRLKQILRWNSQIHGFDFIEQILKATPTAELRPLKEGEVTQTDEEDMGLSYSDLELFGRLRKVDKLGPVSMFDKVHGMQIYSTEVLAQKLKRFFKFYGINRHKMTIITPSFHYDPESCDDNRFDMRPIMYSTDWDYQFKIIDERVKKIMQKKSSKTSAENKKSELK